MTARRFYVETLGCPKNAVDSDKIVASLVSDGLQRTDAPENADLVVVNTCAFVDAARRESIDTILALDDQRSASSQLVVTGCLAERAGDELREALPEVDAVIGFANESEIAPIALEGRKPTGVRDLLDLPRAAPEHPWAYLKIAEGCDRACAFCAIPSFRGAQRSRSPESIESEARALVANGVSEIVLVAQDLAWYGRDVGQPRSLAPLLERLDTLAGDGLTRIRLLYLYPSEVRGTLVETMLGLPTVVPYFDLSLQHASAPLLRSMKRWGSGERFVDLIGAIRNAAPDAVFRSSFISGFPGESELDHAQLLEFLSEVCLDWAGFFPFSEEDGTAAATLDSKVPTEVISERLVELAETQEPIMASGRRRLVGSDVEVLIDRADDGDVVGRTWREAPEIDGIVRLEHVEFARAGARVDARVTDSIGPDLEARPLAASASIGDGRYWRASV